jgi:hypothetical protein
LHQVAASAVPMKIKKPDSTNAFFMPITIINIIFLQILSVCSSFRALGEAEQARGL